MINYLIILFLLISTCLNGIDLEIQEMRDYGMILFLINDKDSGKKEVLSLPYKEYSYEQRMHNINPYILFVKYRQYALSMEDAQFFFSVSKVTEENYGITLPHSTTDL